jgi:hypothetical protein
LRWLRERQFPINFGWVRSASVASKRGLHVVNPFSVREEKGVKSLVTVAKVMFNGVSTRCVVRPDSSRSAASNARSASSACAVVCADPCTDATRLGTDGAEVCARSGADARGVCATDSGKEKWDSKTWWPSIFHRANGCTDSKAFNYLRCHLWGLMARTVVCN